MSLEEEIQRLITLGEKDPLDAARKLIEANGPEWVNEQLAAYQEDVIAEMFRRRLGAIRRGAELVLHPGDQHSQGELKLASAWVPGVGWKRAADLTAEDLRARAHFYDVIAHASQRRSAWCREVASMMDEDNVRTLGKLRRPLPALPDDDDLPQIEAVG